PTPAPDSTTTATPLFTSDATAFGTNATRRSYVPDSATTPTVVCGSVMARTSTFPYFPTLLCSRLPQLPYPALPERKVVPVLRCGPRTEVAPLGFVDRDVVDAGLAARHQPRRCEFPQLVAVA